MPDRDPPGGKRRSRTQTERDLEGLAARKERHRRMDSQLEELVEAERELMESRHQHQDGTVLEELEGVDTGMTPRIEEDPDLLRLYHKIEKGLRRERSKRASDILAVVGEKPPAEVMSGLERTIRRLKYLIVAVAIPAGSSAILVGKYLTDRAASNERTLIERQQLVDKVAEHERIIKEISDLAKRNATLIEILQPKVNHQ
jgi:hypothetical protein